MTYRLSKRQLSTLEGLAYRIADSAYMRERYGDDEPELESNHRTIKGLFDELDKLQTPFWVQNTVICWAEDWRRYKNEYITEALKAKGITC